MKPDFGRTASDYGKHRAGFPDSFFDRLQRLQIGVPGQSVVDLGTGTGTLARGFAARGCAVVGIDPSPSMLEEARSLARDAGLEAEFRVGTAEATGLDDTCADIVIAGQCWHWFDRPLAAREAVRLLVGDGTLVIAHFDWIPLPGNVVADTEKLIESHNPDWGHGGGLGIHHWWLPDLGVAGFRDLETFSYDLDVHYTPEVWRGRIRASAGVGASLSQERVDAFDADLAALLDAKHPGGNLDIPHRVFAVIARRPER
jgi:SAM-dependent methyltransferase